MQLLLSLSPVLQAPTFQEIDVSCRGRPSPARPVRPIRAARAPTSLTRGLRRLLPGQRADDPATRVAVSRCRLLQLAESARRSPGRAGQRLIAVDRRSGPTGHRRNTPDHRLVVAISRHSPLPMRRASVQPHHDRGALVRCPLTAARQPPDLRGPSTVYPGSTITNARPPINAARGGGGMPAPHALTVEASASRTGCVVMHRRSADSCRLLAVSCGQLFTCCSMS